MYFYLRHITLLLCERIYFYHYFCLMYRGLKISENRLLRDRKSDHFRPQLHPPGTLPKCNKTENEMHFGTTLIKAISPTKFERNLFLAPKKLRGSYRDCLLIFDSIVLPPTGYISCGLDFCDWRDTRKSP